MNTTANSYVQLLSTTNITHAVAEFAQIRGTKPATAATSSSHSGFRTGTLIIVVASVLGALFTIVVVASFCCRRRNNPRRMGVSGPTPALGRYKPLFDPAHAAEPAAAYPLTEYDPNARYDSHR